MGCGGSATTACSCTGGSCSGAPGPGNVTGPSFSPGAPTLVYSSNPSMPPAVPLSHVAATPTALVMASSTLASAPRASRGNSARVVPFARNQLALGINHVTNEFYTDPVPLYEADRITMHLHLAYAFSGAGTFEFHGKAEVSNDGTHWVDSGVSADLNFIPPFPVIPVTGAVHGAFLRIHYIFIGRSPDLCAFCFDIHALLDKS